jgi:phosphatidylinositol dimannoside acyltransferase
MTLQDVLNGPLAISLVFGLTKITPPRLGHGLAARLGNIYGGWRRVPSVQAARANQWVVAGGRLSARRLDELTRAVFQSTAHGLYDFYHNLNNIQAALDMVEIDTSVRDAVEWYRSGHTGALVVIPHVSNFELLAPAFANATLFGGLKVQFLSYPQPPAGYSLQNRIRRMEGLSITPISMESIRQAIQLLKQGGVVVTGVDRPMNDEKNCAPLFFGRPSCLPSGYVRLALKAGVPVVVVSGQTLPDGRYRLVAFDPILMQPYPDKTEELCKNAQSVLAIIEKVIRRAPEQWAMFYPVWPEALQEIPS